MSEVERARRDVKEEATKAAKAELEVLHGKLLHSENVGKATIRTKTNLLRIKGNHLLLPLLC